MYVYVIKFSWLSNLLPSSLKYIQYAVLRRNKLADVYMCVIIVRNVITNEQN